MGSFVEDTNPNDLDTVAFLFRPPGVGDSSALADLMEINSAIFDRAKVRASHGVDFIPVDLEGAQEELIKEVCYWLGMFSHRRNDDLWKGVLQITLEDEAEDKAAYALLETLTVKLSA
ncbi:hypothetical protein B7R25_08855 [Subtercola boreus]|uniref:Uncharacterized protein n=1 Tax=Subtercola boreus TaxID=120213 RepID=A0A3E0WA97_9MICO|nr:hypothetical protein B7R24_08790 [Subtercola boreus]RFA20960.1 hypothetical protein B7R23_08725 [Subtercola boreus]RFA27154.1 hypothetical protein B7R25_08855 [Subtercola boreus]